MNIRTYRKLTPWLGALALGAASHQALAVDFHVATAQDLQTALSLAAATSVSNNIYVTNGYYIGNFNFTSSNANSLTILAEPGVVNTQIVIDSGGTGNSMNISGSATANITVQGMTFLRNCGSGSLAGLQIAGSNTTVLVNGCQFLSPTNSSGMGLNITAGLNVTVTNCAATGSLTGSGGTGIAISSSSNNVTVAHCTFTSNFGAGLGASAAQVVAVSDSLFAGNTGNGYGGGASCGGATVTLSGNTFTGNSAGAYSAGWRGFYGNGGGADCAGTTVTLSGNSFISNSAGGSTPSGWAGGFGGGAHCSGTTVTLTGNTFTGNSTIAGPGGGAYCSGTVTLTGNSFTSNSAVGNSYLSLGGGGGVYFDGSGGVTLSSNAFTGNSSDVAGGGVCWSSTLTNLIAVSGNTFLQNISVLGGGLYASGPTVNLLDNLVADNAATNASATSAQGGGVWVDASATLNMINNTVFGNRSAGNGGGVAYVVTGTVELLNVYNNIIWGNSATNTGGDVWLSGTGQRKVFDFNDVDNMSGVWDIAQNNTDLSPKFFDPINGDYHIQGTSPCRNAGTNGAPSLPLTDLDGNARTNSAGQVDLGCYEFNNTLTHPADTNGDFFISAAEFNAYAAAWKSLQTWTNGPNPGPNPIPANYMTRAGYLMTNGGAYYNDGSARPTNWKIKP